MVKNDLKTLVCKYRLKTLYEINAIKVRFQGPYMMIIALFYLHHSWGPHAGTHSAYPSLHSVSSVCAACGK